MPSAFDAVQHWPTFVAAGLLLNLTPGADMALVARASAAQGWRAGAPAAISRQLGRRARWVGLGRWLNRSVGTLFVALGLRLAWGDGRA